MLGAIAGSVIGGIMANRAAKNQAGAMDRATAANMAGFNLSRPFLSYGYNQNRNALDNALAMGAYSGDRYAGFNPMQDAAYGGMFDFGQNQANIGQNLMGIGQGFGQNYQDLYNRASQDMLGNAINYAGNNFQPLLDAAMLDDRRNLDENVLTGLDMAGTGTGNTNSSRSVVADAIAERGFADRRAKTATDIQDSLIARSMNAQNNQLSNMMGANQGLYNALAAGQNFGGAGFGDMARAGGALQTDAQNQLNADQAAFEDQRDFQLGAVGNYMGNLQGAPTSVSGIQPNYNDPFSASMGGAMAGFGFGNQYLQPMFNNFGGGAMPQTNFATNYLPTAMGYQ